MVHCHGGMAPADEQMSIPMQIASHGYMVISPDFMEGQCCWTSGKDGEDIWYDTVHEFSKVPQKLKDGTPNPESFRRANLQYD